MSIPQSQLDRLTRDPPCFFVADDFASFAKVGVCILIDCCPSLDCAFRPCDVSSRLPPFTNIPAFISIASH